MSHVQKNLNDLQDIHVEIEWNNEQVYLDIESCWINLDILARSYRVLFHEWLLAFREGRSE